MLSLLYKIFYQPLFNVFFVTFFFIYDYLAFQDFGVAIVILTIVVRIVLYPLFHKGMYHQTAMQRLQPKIKEIQNRHKGDMQKQSEALMDLYRDHKVNPFSGFLFLLIQLPIFIAMYGLIRGFTGSAAQPLYSYVAARPEINEMFLGLINMHERSILLIAIAAIFQYLQGLYSLSRSQGSGEGSEPSAAEQMGRNMVYIMPGITVVFLWNFPSALALYWGTTAALSIAQQYFINKALSGDVSKGEKNHASR